MSYSQRDYQQLCKSLETVTDLVCEKVDIQSKSAATTDVAECLKHLSHLIVEIQKMPSMSNTPSGVEASGNVLSPAFLQNTDRVVHHISDTPYLQRAYRNDPLFERPISDIAVYLITNCGESRIKAVHAEIISQCKSSGNRASEGDIDVLEWMLYIHNLNIGQRGRVAGLVYPEVGKRFMRSDMIPVVNSMSGNITFVLVPGIPELGLKALVNLV
jgi:hypothetical protein